MKGRDYYDLLYYSARGIPVNSQHLIRRLEQSGVRAEDAEDARVMLRERCLSVDYRDAVSDVLPFVLDKRKLDNWSPELFASVVDGLRFVRNHHASHIHNIASSES